MRFGWKQKYTAQCLDLFVKNDETTQLQVNRDAALND